MESISAPPIRAPKQSAATRLAPPYPNEGWRANYTARRLAASAESLAVLASVRLALDSLPVRAIRGRLGDLVFKTYGRKIVVTRVPCFVDYVPSAAQRARRDRMRAATAYARCIYADPAAKACYTAAAKKLGRQPFRLAVSDFLRGNERVEMVAALCGPRDPAHPVPLHVTPPRPDTRRDRRGPPRSLQIVEHALAKTRRHPRANHTERLWEGLYAPTRPRTVSRPRTICPPCFPRSRAAAPPHRARCRRAAAVGAAANHRVRIATWPRRGRREPPWRVAT